MKLLSTLLFSLLITTVTISQLKTTNSGRSEIICPSHLELEFPQNVLKNFAGVVGGGYPIAAFKEAKVEGKKLVAVYNYQFSTYNDFAIKCWQDDIDRLPNSISLQVKNSSPFYNDWKLMDDIKIDRTASGWLIESIVVDESLIEQNEDVKYKSLGWYGGTYSKTTQNNRQPKLYMEFDGHAKVNEDGTGFYIANSITELNDNQGNILHAPDKSGLDDRTKKPKKPINKPKPIKKKFPK